MSSLTLPVGWAHFSVLLEGLESLNQSEDFVNISSDWWVIHGDVTDILLWIDDESSSEVESSIQVHNAIVLSNNVVGIRKQWDVDTSQTSFLTWSVDPGQVSETGINRNTDDLSTDLSEVLSLVREGNDFSGADKGEVSVQKSRNTTKSKQEKHTMGRRTRQPIFLCSPPKRLA